MHTTEIHTEYYNWGLKPAAKGHMRGTSIASTLPAIHMYYSFVRPLSIQCAAVNNEAIMTSLHNTVFSNTHNKFNSHLY
jgi:hypothetical protein